jgi:hypothetical protein
MAALLLLREEIGSLITYSADVLSPADGYTLGMIFRSPTW